MSSWSPGMEWEQWLAPRVVSIVLLGIFILYHSKLKHRNISSHAIGGACNNPTCVRCLNYKIAPDTLFDRLKAFQCLKGHADSSLQRIVATLDQKAALRLVYDKRHATTQSPTVFHVVELNSTPYPTFKGSKWIMQLLELNFQVIHREFEELLINAKNWTNNTHIDSGRWNTLYLLNQGARNDWLCKLCPETVEILESIPDLIWDGAFGNIFFSAISHDTVITPHCGPTNARLRLQLPLSLPKRGKSVLTVDGIDYIQEQGVCIIFDDSFEHSASFRCHTNADVIASDAQKRVNLILDLWHPDLTQVERGAIVHLYPTAGAMPNI